MSKKDVQQTLDAKVFAPYKVASRKITFAGGWSIEEKDLEEKGPGLTPGQTYLFMVKGRVSGASLKFGNDATAGTVAIKLHSLEKVEAVAEPDPLEAPSEEKPKDKPHVAPSEDIPQDVQDEIASEPDENEIPKPEQDESPEPEETVGELAHNAYPTAGEPEEHDEPEPLLTAVPDDAPQCYGTWEPCPECQGCKFNDPCRTHTEAA